MKKIRVIQGGCGIKYTDVHGNARHALKTAESGPFECDDIQAGRLVRLGVAKYVEKVGNKEIADIESTADFKDPDSVTGYLSAEELETWDYNDLKKLAADMGAEPEGKKKADYIAAIVAEQVEVEELDNSNELPELDVADPE